MKKEPILVIMAAGMGSRFGGLKQIEPISDKGEIILDFSLYDAFMAGFKKAIFVIKRENEEDFRKLIDNGAAKYMKVDYAFQQLNDLPDGYSVPEGREKPWGTAHAVMAARHLADGPIAVINADDYYGPGAFQTIYDFLEGACDGEKYSYCMVGYDIENTLTENGFVSRGVCKTSEQGFLTEITERTKIQWKDGEIVYTEDDGKTWKNLPKGTTVSMNFWAFEEKFITVNEAAIKREITKINKATKASCEKITVMLHELDERAKRLKAVLTDDQIIPDNSSIFYKFIREVRNCIGAKCAFLRNESSEVIFKAEKQEREYFRSDISRVILQTYLNRVYTGPDKDEIQKQISENKDFSLSEAALNEFEKYLNEHIPEFENGMYERIAVEQSDGKLPSILLHEKSGEIVDLNSTSAGRRWYFTYYFMKNTLKNGDLFIIDEPAAMLHPIAQKEVLKELLELEHQGINVIYSTHSPYLIPNDWKSVHFVMMTDGGTTVTQENKYDALKQVTGGDIFDLQALLERYQKCGPVGAAHNCYKALIHKYGSIEKAAKNVPFSYDTIEAWKKKKRGTSFENVINISNALAVSPKELL